MDPLNWLLLSWLFIAAFVFFVLQKVVQMWPEQLGGVRDAVTDPVHNRNRKSKSPGTVQRDESFLNRLSTAVTSAAASVRDAAVSAKAEAAQMTAPKAPANEWVNDLILWLYNQYKGTPVCINVWLKSLNDSAKKVANTAGCEVLFEEMIEGSNSACHITNLRAEQGPRDHLTVRASIHCPCVGVRLVSSQKLPDRLLVSNYDVRINELRGEGNGVDPECVKEAVRQCIVAAVTNLNLSGLSLHEDKTVRDDTAAYRPLIHDIPDVDDVYKKINNVAHNKQPDQRNIAKEKLLVRVLQAQKLGTIQVEPYVVIELDDPSQKHTTTLSNGPSPSWDEQFLFELGDRSEEILFEVYGKREQGESVFLGLAIVGIDELRHSASTTHTLTLQARPYRNDPISGVLITEFSFSGVDFDMGRLVDMRREEQGNTVFTKISASAKRPLVQNYQDYDADHVITPVKTTSLLVKSVSQYFQAPANEGAESKPGDPTSTPLVHATTDQSAKASAPPPIDRQLDKREDQQASPTHHEPQLARSSKRASQNLEGHDVPIPSTSHLSPPSVDGRSSGSPSSVRGRPEKRTHSFFGDLKQRLSFRGKSKKRAASEGRNPDEVYHPPRAVSTPPSRDQSESRYSTRARSDVGSTGEVMSTTSSESLYHMSTLVIEVVKNNIKRYYLIPPNMLKHPEARKIMKQGKKLHVFNEHMFCAFRVKSGTKCFVCDMRIAGSFGKQAYQCRDCRMVCHKRCHFKTTDNYCLNSTVSKLEMEYVWSEKR